MGGARDGPGEARPSWCGSGAAAGGEVLGRLIGSRCPAVVERRGDLVGEGVEAHPARRATEDLAVVAQRLPRPDDGVDRLAEVLLTDTAHHLTELVLVEIGAEVHLVAVDR